MSHTLTKVLTVGGLRVALNDDGELEISTKRGVVVTLNDAGDLEALADLVMDARLACDPEALMGDGSGVALPEVRGRLAVG